LDQPADIEAELTFLTTAEGGRKTSCRSGLGNYRAPCDFGHPEGWNDALFEFVDKEWVSPGECVIARMWFLYPEYQAGHLRTGFEFTVHEGARAVARGTVKQVLNTSLLKL
jgi:hypothetical protein